MTIDLMEALRCLDCGKEGVLIKDAAGHCIECGGRRFEAVPAEDENDPKLPAYSDPGRILVRVSPPTGTDKFDYEVLAYDEDASPFWINEGTGFDWWFVELCEFPGPGVYVIEGVVGTYHHGDWSWGEDDDESWEVGNIRPATAEEIETECLPEKSP